ncbi:hypothetical protein SCLCIDRAFT_8647 [Scleroderma citrinum Foug A]|uniref:Uncharacterized protein n=1 Tax=Scleroderma citrinum Foug A TaxID=1036808 RepID=A0A0C3DUA1_9AGAM|nr:hypothetical protein SCLCIDRAFT_8647 [Scleroderma citrinum Foug A]
MTWRTRGVLANGAAVQPDEHPGILNGQEEGWRTADLINFRNSMVLCPWHNTVPCAGVMHEAMSIWIWFYYFLDRGTKVDAEYPSDPSMTVRSTSDEGGTWMAHMAGCSDDARNVPCVAELWGYHASSGHSGPYGNIVPTTVPKKFPRPRFGDMSIQVENGCLPVSHTKRGIRVD